MEAALRAFFIVCWILLGLPGANVARCVAESRLSIESATIKPDGRILQLTFSASPMPAKYGMPDWMPGAAQRKALSLSTGAKLEHIGSWATIGDLPMPSIEDSGKGNPLPTGEYWIAYTIVDSSGKEIQVSPPAKISLKRLVDQASGKLMGTMAQISNTGGFSLPKGLSANVYLTQSPNADVSTMTLYKTVSTPDGAPATARLDTTTWLDPSRKFPGYKKLSWTAHYLIKDAPSVVTINQQGLTVSAPNGLLQDGSGNVTAQFSSFPVSNLSLVDASGFTSQTISPSKGGVILYVSSSKGKDSNTFVQAQDPKTPLATPSKAMKLLIDNQQFSTGAQILLRKGDMWIDQFIPLSAMGADQKHPMVLGNYWDGDPKNAPIRPTLIATKLNAQIFGSGDRPGPNRFIETSDILIRGLHILQANLKGSGTGIGLLAGGSGLTIDDCIIQNFGANLLTQVHWRNHRYLSGLTVLRTALIDSHAGTGAHTAGAFIHLSKDLLISQSIFDNNGKVSDDGKQMDIFSHNLYFQDSNYPGIFWGNMFRDGGSHGSQIRAGGIAAYNVYARNAIAGFVGGVGGGFYKNSVLQSRDIINSFSGNLPRGHGLAASSAKTNTGEITALGFQVGQIHEQNIMVNAVSQVYPMAHAIEINAIGSLSPGSPQQVILRNNTAVNHGPGVTMSAYGSGDAAKSSLIFEYCNVMQNQLSKGTPIFAIQVPKGISQGWFYSDQNVFSAPSLRPFQLNGAWLGRDQLTNIGLESNSAFSKSALQVQSPAADLGSYFATLPGGRNSEAGFVTKLTMRLDRVWGPQYDLREVWSYMAKSYRLVNSSAIAPGNKCEVIGAG